MHRPPADLTPRGPGRALWKAVMDGHEPDGPHDLAILSAAARTADELARLEAALAPPAPVLVKGSLGQERVNPLFPAVLAHRAALTRLLGQLGIAPEATEAKSDVGRKLALLRHHGGRRAS